MGLQWVVFEATHEDIYMYKGGPCTCLWVHEETSYHYPLHQGTMEDTLERCFDNNQTVEARLEAISKVNAIGLDFRLIEAYSRHFIELLSSENVLIRINAIDILGHIKDDSAVEPLISMIPNATRGVMGELSPILCALWEINDWRAIGPILELVKSELESGDMDSAMTALEILQYKGEVIVPDISVVNAHRYELKIIEGQ
jgi:hypothetical protein